MLEDYPSIRRGAKSMFAALCVCLVCSTASGQSDGSSCSYNSDCSSGDCEGRCCKANIDSSGCTTCNSDGDCTSCSPSYYKSRYRCYRKKSTGYSCSSDGMCTSGHCVVSLTCSGFCVSYDDYYSYTYYYSDTPAIVGGVVGDVLGLLLIISVIVVIIVVRRRLARRQATTTVVVNTGNKSPAVQMAAIAPTTVATPATAGPVNV